MSYSIPGDAEWLEDYLYNGGREKEIEEMRRSKEIKDKINEITRQILVLINL